ncbi:MAG: flagellar protein export ATPase FliI [Firmicutes bacterium]|nr:flagellar protein export ATPase FliI [Bacillota bacterium]
MALNWQELRGRIAGVETAPLIGQVTGVVGLVIQSRGPRAMVGELCWLSPGTGDGTGLWAEVVGFREKQVLLMPLGSLDGLSPGWEVRATGAAQPVPVGPELLGRVLDGLGRPLDGKGPLAAAQQYPVNAMPPDAMSRRRITEPLSTGVRAIDGLLTVGKGQRIGIFAGSGVGKSTLLGMMARGTTADVNVIALVGERGREVREFIEEDLGEEGLRRSVVVVATSDQPALVRIRGALVATAIAEFFRDQGLDVLLMMDSVTRLAMAQREVGLAVGEPPATRGYTPSVFAMLPRVLERSGNGSQGSITGIYTVLVDGDDVNEPIADAVRGILDGHIVLSRRLGSLNHYPAIDVLASVSRTMPQVTTQTHRRSAARLRANLALYRENEDLVNIGAYQSGANPALDYALRKLPGINRYLQQATDELIDLPTALGALAEIFPEGE